ncbi:MAG: DMT family transporter [Planctomycetota bacterium]
MRDFLQLHCVIALWGFTAVLGVMIELSATQLVFYRSAAASLILFAFLGNSPDISRGTKWGLFGNGAILGFHWIMFFIAVKIANVSICMIGMATISFWTAIFEPLLNRKCRFEWLNAVLGCVIVYAVFLIFHTESAFHRGLAVAIVGAILATLFSIFNGMLSDHADSQEIVMWEMFGAAVFCALAMLVMPIFDVNLASNRWWPTLQEWFWMTILVLACTLLAYRMYVQLLSSLSVFTINFANNLEPVYGISLGVLFFSDHETLGSGFYTGGAIILVTVVLQPLMARWQQRRQRRAEGRIS